MKRHVVWMTLCTWAVTYGPPMAVYGQDRAPAPSAEEIEHVPATPDELPAVIHPMGVVPFYPSLSQSFRTPTGDVIGTHQGRVWWLMPARRHGFPYNRCPHLPRFVGASYNFPQWLPRRSYYYPYTPGQPYAPYGFSPEPYYPPTGVPAMVEDFGGCPEPPALSGPPPATSETARP